MNPRITVLDFGMGNLRSVAKALERAGAQVDLSTAVDPGADGLVVPGRGAFGSCIANLGEQLNAVREWIADGHPYLGICLGLQVLFDSSEESREPGAGILEGPVRKLPDGLKIPHIGWNEVIAREKATLFEGIDPGTRFYFVHSFYPDPADAGVIAATTEYGIEFCCAAERDNVFATQFHPEKSGDDGQKLLRNFLSTL